MLDSNPYGPPHESNVGGQGKGRSSSSRLHFVCACAASFVIYSVDSILVSPVSPWFLGVGLFLGGLCIGFFLSEGMRAVLLGWCGYALGIFAASTFRHWNWFTVNAPASLVIGCLPACAEVMAIATRNSRWCR